MFAYGSNLDRSQVSARCPSSRPLVAARLDGFTLCFPYYAQSRAGGAASIMESPGSHVWGALYDLTPEDLNKMDTHEGRRTNPRRRLPVYVPEWGTVEAWTYQYAGQRTNTPPSPAYLGQILTGCEAWGLPHDYVQSVRLAALKPGPQDGRGPPPTPN